MTEADEALRRLGKFSKWHMMNYLACAIGFGLPFPWMSLSIVFIGDTPPHHCALPPNVTMNGSIPQECDSAGQCTYSQCHMYAGPGTNDTVPCQNGWWYDPDYGYESTIVTDWDLVCGSNWLMEFSMTMKNVGGSLGTLIFTRLSDLYGRKIIFSICLVCNVFISTIQAFSPNYIFFLVMAFIHGMELQGFLATTSVMAVEIFPPEQRNFALNCIEFFWAFGYISLVLFVYYIRNWRHLQLAITLPFILTFVFCWFIDESIPWLVAQGRYKDANEIVRRAGKFNKISVPDKFFNEDAEEANAKKKVKKSCWDHIKRLWEGNDLANGQNVPVTDIFKNKTMAIWTFALFLIWFVNNLAYYAVNFTVTYLPGDRYLNALMYGLIELPSYTVTWILLEKYGRVRPLVAFHILAGLALIGTCVDNFEFGQQNQWLVITLSILGKFFITNSYATIVVHTPEIFPTNVRNTGYGMCACVSVVASFIVPYTRILARYAPWMPPVIMGLSSVLAGLCALLLPETRWMPLPETIEDITAWKGKDVGKIAMKKYMAEKAEVERLAKEQWEGNEEDEMLAREPWGEKAEDEMLAKEQCEQKV